MHQDSRGWKSLWDESEIASRVNKLRVARNSSRYSKQRTALELEFCGFLSALYPAKNLLTALPCDVIAYLVWKDKIRRWFRSRIARLLVIRESIAVCALNFLQVLVEELNGTTFWEWVIVQRININKSKASRQALEKNNSGLA